MGAWAGGRRHRRRQLPMHGPPAWPDRTVHSAVHRATQRARTHGGSARARARPAGRKCTHAPTWRLHARSPGGGPRPHIPLVFEEKAKCRMRGRRPHVRARALARMHTQTRARGEDGVGHRALRTRGSHSRLEDPPPHPLHTCARTTYQTTKHPRWRRIQAVGLPCEPDGRPQSRGHASVAW